MKSLRMLLGFSELGRTVSSEARIGANMDSWIVYLLPVLKLPESIPVGGNGHQPPREPWLHTGVALLLPLLRQEGAGAFPLHFSCSLNTREPGSLGFWCFNSEHTAGGVTVCGLLLRSFSTPTPLLYSSSHLRSWGALC